MGLYGFPLKAEQKANLALLDEPTDRLVASQDCATVLTSDAAASSDLCSKGFATVRPDGFYNLSRTYEMDTKGRGTAHGPTHMHTLVLYFPSTTGNADPSAGDIPAPQKLMIEDFDIQAKTFIGLEADQGNYQADLRSGYRANVEDFKQLWAVPNQPLASTPTADGLELEVDGDRHNWVPTSDDLVAAPGALADTGCPRSNAPGYPTSTSHGTVDDSSNLDGWLHTKDRGPGDGGMFMGYHQPCEQNTVEGGQPRHIEAPTPARKAWMSNPSKSISDAWQYQFNIDVFEEFTKRTLPKTKPPKVHPLNYPHVPDPGQSLSDLTPSPSPPITKDELVRDWSGLNLAEASKVLDNRLFKLQNATPFIHPSWQGVGGEGSPGTQTVHNYLVMNETKTFELVEDRWDPLETIQRTDRSTQELQQDATLNEVVVHGQSLPNRNQTDEHAGVFAHGFDAHVNQAPERQTAGFHGTKIATALVGNGRTGTGVALEVQEEMTATLDDGNRSSFLNGHQIDGYTTVNITAHKLGGKDTAGSDCYRVALYSYIEHYFRCTGVESTTVITHLESGVSQNCYQRALNFVEAAHGHALNVSDDAVNGESWFTGGDARRAVQGLRENPRETKDPRDQRQVDRTVGYVGKTAGLQQEAMALATCVDAEANLFPSFSSDQFTTIQEESQEALDSALNGTRNRSLLNVTQALDEDLFENGEPFWGVKATFDEPDLRDGFMKGKWWTDDGGDRRWTIDWVLEEWQTRLDEATITFTDQTSNTTETWDTVQGPLNGSYQEHTNYTFDHGEAYRVDLNATDQHGDETNDHLDFLVDLKDPTVSWIDAPKDWTNDTYRVDANISDPVSGLEKIWIVLYIDDGGDYWKEVTKTVPLPEEGVSSHNFTAHVNLGDFSTGDLVQESEIRFKDQAGNEDFRGLTKPELDLDVPSIGGLIQTDEGDRVVEDPLKATLSANEEGESGLDEVAVALVNQETGKRADEKRDDSFTGEETFSATDVPLSVDSANATYALEVSARDQAGNEVTGTADEALVQLMPTVDMLQPGNETVQALPFPLEAQGDAWIPGFEETPVDVTISMVAEGETLEEETVHNVTGSFTAPLDDLSTVDPGDYNIVIEGRHGRTNATGTANLTVSADTDPQALEETRAFADLNQGERQRWRIDIDTTCVDQEQALSVMLYDRDLDLYLDRGQDAGTDPSGYWKNDTSDEEIKRINWWNVQTGDAFTALLDAPDAGSDQYRIVAWTWCYESSSGGGGDPADPPSNDIMVPR